MFSEAGCLLSAFIGERERAYLVVQLARFFYIYIFVSQIKSAATHFISRASRQFIQVQNLKVITTKISYFRQTTQVNSNI